MGGENGGILGKGCVRGPWGKLGKDVEKWGGKWYDVTRGVVW